jgi:translin
MITIDFPDAVTGGLRRTTDSLRAVLERTRGDLTLTKQQEKLRRTLLQFEATLKDGAQD